MPGVMDSVSTVNSLIRTLLGVVIVAMVGLAGWYGYSVYNAHDRELKERDEELAEVRNRLDTQSRQLQEKQLVLDQQVEMLAERDRQITDLNLDLKKKLAQIQKLDTSLRLLKVNHRVAWLTVVDQGTDDATKDLYTDVSFVEVNDKGEAIDAPRKFRIRGDVVYIDNWVVKFDDKYVEQADIDRATSLVLFRRLFGESQTPNDGFSLDTEGARPRAYSGNHPMSEFEKKIWVDFWSIANDPEKAKELGIRAAHGEAPSMKLKPGKSYKVQLRSSDGLSITPDNGPPPIVTKPAA